AAVAKILGYRAGRFLARLESLEDRRLVPGSGGQAGLVVDPDQLDARRRAEGSGRGAGERLAHEIAHHGRGEHAAGLAMTERVRLVETEIDADDEIGRKADEPGVLVVVGGAGLAGDRTIEHLQLLRRAALDHPFHDVDHLEGRHRIDDLLAVIDELRLLLTLPLARGAGAA